MAADVANRTIAELDKLAQAMYDSEAGWRDFAEQFTAPELTKLATLCQMDREGNGGRGYDDEVFDALAILESES